MLYRVQYASVVFQKEVECRPQALQIPFKRRQPGKRQRRVSERTIFCVDLRLDPTTEQVSVFEVPKHSIVHLLGGHRILKVCPLDSIFVACKIKQFSQPTNNTPVTFGKRKDKLEWHSKRKVKDFTYFRLVRDRHKIIETLTQNTIDTYFTARDEPS
jgi:hypothetical protein